MLPEAKRLVEALKREQEAIDRGEDTTKFYSQPDYDLGEVLEHCFNGKIKKHKLPFDDGTFREVDERIEKNSKIKLFED